MNRLIARVKSITAITSHHIRQFLLQEPPFPGWQLMPIGFDLELRTKVDTRSAKEIVEQTFDGFLWDVQKKRRSIERRMVRKFGAENWGPHGKKMLTPKTNIITCGVCGHFHESQYLCNHCYEKNMKETKAIQEQINTSHGFDPIDKEVRIKYKNDNYDNDQLEFKARLVEIDAVRPSWFSNNLLSKTGQTLPEKNVTLELEAENKLK